MLEFVICEDDPFWNEKFQFLVDKAMMKYDFEYNKKIFYDYSNELNDLIKNVNNFRIYILDVQLPTSDGIRIATNIRKNDWKSFIIMLTAFYDENWERAYKETIMLIEFINKQFNYEERLINDIHKALLALPKKNIFAFYSNSLLVKTEVKNILYIMFDSSDRVCTVVTYHGNYRASRSLKSFIDELDENFIQSHKACIININNVTSIDTKNKVIYFKENFTTDLLSVKYMREIKENWDKLADN